jgi:protein-tyrosine phosphatase
VLVFCALGYSRSVMAVAAWLVSRGHATNTDQAVSMIAAQRPGIALSPAHLSRLKEWSREQPECECKEGLCSQSLLAL